MLGVLMTAQSGQSIPRISVETLAQLLQEASEQIQFVDVREPQELAIAALEGFENFPLSEFADWSTNIHTRLDPTKETVVLCHHGVRSAQMCQWLMSQGFTQVRNVVGGIDEYSMMVDPTVPRY